MILSGILDTSLGGFTVIRGFARLGDLARCSEFDGDYQRLLIQTHKKEIEQFLDNRRDLFFPEVILSASLEFDFNKYRGKRDITPIQNILNGKGFVSNVNNLKVQTVKGRLPNNLKTVGALNAPQMAYLTFPDGETENGKELKLFRIDGNHRLSAANKATPNNTMYNLITPFCIVLHDDDAKAKYFERAVFHNINAKQIPLTSEENLRLILEDSDEDLFSDKELMENPSFGSEYYLARKILSEIKLRHFDSLSEHMKNSRSAVLAMTQFLIEKGIVKSSDDPANLDDEVPRLIGAIQKVNIIYGEKTRTKLKENGCHGVLVAFLYFSLYEDGRRLSAFTRWVASNRIDRLDPPVSAKRFSYHYYFSHTQAVNAASLVDVFESILTAKHREIFISMAFRVETRETYKAIRKTVHKINEKHDLDIKLREIRIDKFIKGHSYTIDDEILEIIEGTGLMIADLTFGNRNVYHEIGYLMGLNRGRGLNQENFILIADEEIRGDELETDIGFNLKSWQQLRFSSTSQLKEKLMTSIEKFYNLEE